MTPASATTPASRLGLVGRVGYGIGDFGFNLFFTTASLYLLFYYTDILGLSARWAGLVFALALIWDALFDPLMGYIANRTRTRWGRYRPYLLFGALPLAASWVLLFWPTSLGGSALILFALATHMLFRTFYAVVSMPYLALIAVIAPDSEERGVLAGFRMGCATLCGLFVAFSTLPLVAAFGGGAIGFQRVAMLYGALACIAFAICFATTRELHDPRVTASAPAWRDIVRMFRSNGAFWLVAMAMLAASLGGTMFGKTLPYFFKYALHREDLIGLALTILTAGVTLAIPFWTWVMRRRSKRVMWLSGLGMALVLYPVLWIAPDAPALWLAVVGLIGVAAGAGYLGFWSMLPDTVEYGEWHSGVRAEGAIFGIISLVQKAGLGIAAGILGLLLDFAGYRANMAQSPETLAAIRQIFVGLPWLFAIATAIAIALYPIDHRLHARLRRALARRQSSLGTQ